MELPELPDSMAVIGGNAVGLELGQLFPHRGQWRGQAEAEVMPN